jgi:hypothetical protein
MQNRTGRTRLAGQKCQDRTSSSRTGLPGKDCQERTARKGLPGPGCQDRTDKINMTSSMDMDMQHGQTVRQREEKTEFALGAFTFFALVFFTLSRSFLLRAREREKNAGAYISYEENNLKTVIFYKRRCNTCGS